MRRLMFAAMCLLGLVGPSVAQDKILHIGLREDPDLLDPTLGSSYVGRIVFEGMCDKLFDIDTKLNIVPQLATGYDWKDPTHLVIHLRPGVLFQDGEKLTADAAKYKLMRDMTAKGSMRHGEVNSIDSIEIIDPLTIQLDLKAPAAQLLAQLTDRAGIMISPKAAEAEGDKFGLHPVCAGPFSFDPASRRTASCCAASPATGTPSRSISTRSCTCRTRTPRCGWPIFRLVRSTWSNTSCRPTSPRCSATRS